MSEDALQKRRAREEKRLAQAAKAAEAATTSESHVSLLVPESEAVSRYAPAELGIPASPLVPESSATVSMPHTVVIPTASSSLEWYNPDAHAYLTIEAAKVDGVWDYPSTLQERARCGVFRNLWEQSYFMGGGIKFGGDYLVYPGTILRSFRLNTSDLVTQVTRCATTHISLLPCWNHRCLPSAPWKLLHMVGWELQRRRRTCFVDGMTRKKMCRIYP